MAGTAAAGAAWAREWRAVSGRGPAPAPGCGACGAEARPKAAAWARLWRQAGSGDGVRGSWEVWEPAAEGGGWVGGGGGGVAVMQGRQAGGAACGKEARRVSQSRVPRRGAGFVTVPSWPVLWLILFILWILRESRAFRSVVFKPGLRCEPLQLIVKP